MQYCVCCVLFMSPYTAGSSEFGVLLFRTTKKALTLNMEDEPTDISVYIYIFSLCVYIYTYIYIGVRVYPSVVSLTST